MISGAALKSGSHGVLNAALWGGAIASDIPVSEYMPSAGGALGGMFAFGKITKEGLHSGGLFGYSTFFSGYDPNGVTGTAGRRFSLGRVGGQTVSALGHVLSARGYGGSVSEQMKSFNRLGMMAFAGPDGNPGLRKWTGWLGGITADGPLNHPAAKHAPRGKVISLMKDGVDTVLPNKVTQVGASKTGELLIKGRMGMAIGIASRLSMAAAIGQIVIAGASHAIGAAYGGLVQANRALSDRVGTSSQLSAGYFNQATATERQRAVMELNQNILNPRTQLMGNEASFSHR